MLKKFFNLVFFFVAKALILFGIFWLVVTKTHALPLSPPNEPKADSFYICYEKRCPNNVKDAIVTRYTRYKYINCLITRLPCHLYCCGKYFYKHAPTKQFQWVNNYPDALNSFYRCAYS